MAYIDVKNSEEFNKEVVESDNLVIVDFWAQWCGPCKMFGPVFERVSDEVSDVKFVKVNVDEAGDVAQKFNIMSIPTIILVKDGKVLDQKSGALADDALKAWLTMHSGNDAANDNDSSDKAA